MTKSYVIQIKLASNFSNILIIFSTNESVDIYFIRHGESEANKERIIQGWLDSPLSELGLEQAKTLQNILPTLYDRVYSSPLQRAKTTALLSLNISEDHEKLIIYEELKEISIGSLEGKPFKDLNVSREDRRNWIRLQTDTLRDNFDSEPIDSFLQRTSAIFDKIVEEAGSSGTSTILIFSHGGTMRSIISNYLKLVNVDDSYYHNTEVVHIALNNGKWILKSRITDHILQNDG